MTTSAKPTALARFAASLARLREAAGWTRFALAKASGLDEIALSRMERGERVPNILTAAKIADALGCTLDELCGRQQ